jgi:uncharacterized oligopeptide transporter (OPT) family protein
MESSHRHSNRRSEHVELHFDPASAMARSLGPSFTDLERNLVQHCSSTHSTTQSTSVILLNLEHVLMDTNKDTSREVVSCAVATANLKVCFVFRLAKYESYNKRDVAHKP